MQTGLGALTLEARNGSPSAKLKGLSSYRAIAAPRTRQCHKALPLQLLGDSARIWWAKH